MNKELLDTFNKIIPAQLSDDIKKDFLGATKSRNGFENSAVVGYSFEEVSDILGFEPNHKLSLNPPIDFRNFFPRDTVVENSDIKISDLIDFTGHKPPSPSHTNDSWFFKFENQYCVMKYDGWIIVEGCIFTWGGSKEILKKLFPKNRSV